jgi:hypothetical protein
MSTMVEETLEEETTEEETREEETTEDGTNAQVPFDSTFTIYIPDFLPEYNLSSLSLDDQNQQLLQKDWLTTGLQDEIQALFPKSHEIKANDDNKRDPIAFQRQISKIFPSGRIFASFKQLDQAADMFLGAWAVKKTTHSKSIQCAYSSSHDKKRKHADPSRRRKLEPTLKDIYKCPFMIRYSFVAYSKNRAVKKPDIFYHVKITTVNFVHTCQLTTIFHRQALQKSGSCQPDLTGLNDVMTLLRQKPNLQAEILRPLLSKYLPHYEASDAMFLVNFRARAFHWNMVHGEKDLTFEAARQLSSKRAMASDEFLLNDNPMQKQNFTDLLRKVMQEDGTTWDALRFLDTMKENNPGFDYRINYNQEGRPEGICWMLPEMRSDLLRFGNCLFLDSQKRQYNTMGWPYIGPVIKDSEMKVRCVAESICVEESHRMYVWITQMLSEMEPRFNLDSIKIIFGDQALTNQILVDLGIEETCILRGDYHHLINEVWPATFGNTLFHQIRGDLDSMLMGTKEQWENSFTSAKKHLLHDADKFSLLEKIYKDPSHYAGWFLKNIEGNLDLHGSVPAEQNHSSVAAHLGRGGSWSVAEQVTKLLDRQTHLTTKRRQNEQKAYVVAVKYKSKYCDQDGYDDEIAKRQLSTYAYANLFHIEFRRSKRLQFSVHENLTLVWPIGKLQDCEELVTITQGLRCSCLRRLAFNIQCRHELCRDGKLDMEKYSNRWLNYRTFNASAGSNNFQMSRRPNHQVPPPPNSLFTQGNNEEHTFNADDNSFCEDSCNLDDDFDDEEDSDNIALSSLVPKTAGDGRLTYQFVVEKAQNLVRLAQTDPDKLGTLCLLLDQLSDRLRNGQNIDVGAFDLTMPLEKENVGNRPVLGTLKPAPNVATSKRKRSRYETRRGIVSAAAKKKSQLPGRSNDLSICPPPKQRKKTCTICKQPKHQRGSCPKIHKFKQQPLDMGKSILSRQTLASSLGQKGRYITHHRQKSDVREVSNSVPTSVLGVVIHGRYFQNHASSKMVLECTFLDQNGDAHTTYQNFFFTIDTISAYLNRSKSNVIVCELEEDLSEGMESMGYPGVPAHTPFDFRTQSEHMGYGFPTLSQSETMGYGTGTGGVMQAEL